MMTTIAIVAVLVAGVVIYLLQREKASVREHQDALSQAKTVNKEMFVKLIRILNQKTLTPEENARIQEELDRLQHADHETKTNAAVERFRKEKKPS